MRRILGAMALLAGVLVNKPTADACGMGKSYHYEEIDVSKTLMVRARGLEQAGEAQAALAVYQRLMFDNDAPMWRRAMAAFAAHRIHLQAGDVEMAMNRLKLAVGLRPQNARAQLAYGQRLVEDDPARAVSALRQALHAGLDGDDKVTAHAYLALAHAKAGELDEAAGHLRIAKLFNAAPDIAGQAQAAIERTPATVVAKLAR